MDLIYLITWGLAFTLLQGSMVHDHLHSRGEKPTTYFAWTGTRFSPLLMMAARTRKTEATIKANQRKKPRR